MSAARETSALVVRGAGDLHGFLPIVEPFYVLLLAGDLVPLDVREDTGLSWRWFSDVYAKWVDQVPAGEVVAIAGDHDFMLQKRIGPGVHDRLLDANWTCLQDAGTKLACGLTVWGTPW